jgi:hypothetical protein
MRTAMTVDPRTVFRCCILSTLLLWIPGQSPQSATATLRGTVTDAVTGIPLEYVNVFLANTLLGSSTGPDGTFRIAAVPPGSYRAVASRVGYLPSVQTLELRDPTLTTLDFRLEPRDVRAEEVSVEAPEPEVWRMLLRMFVTAFVGQSENAEQCAIRNPEVIDLRLDENNGMLLASSDSMVIVDNRALGYRLAVVLDKFEWDTKTDIGWYGVYPRFEPITPQSKEEEDAWRERREKTYRGSLKQLLAATARGDRGNSPFLVFSGAEDMVFNGHGNLVTPDELTVRPDFRPGRLQLFFSGWLRVEYREPIPPLVSYLKLKAPYAIIDSSGNLLTPYALVISGAWARSRIADLLPFEWPRSP